uniref:Galectin n=1 Tax=Ascaris suum TaxID=6253 RepID=F1LAD2_ASCSU
MAEQKSYPIPYRSQLQEKIEPGQTVIIKGSTIEESQRFTVSLHCKTADFSGNDVPLHLSFRFDEGKVVMNTFSNGEWGKEERKTIPYKKGEKFDLRIRAHDDRFQIFCDQKEFKDYEHRLPLSSISHLSIDGDLYLNQVHWGGKYYPVPYESGIAQGFGVQKSLLIFACPEKKAKRFNVNLLRKNGDIALHFNPRFDEKAVVRNALQAGEWGNEEKEGKIPFEKGVGFDLTITNEPYAFQIFVNGERFCSFAHRSDPHDITGLQIQGDLELTGIQIH